MNPDSELTIVIVSYGSRSDLEGCLPSIYGQSYQPSAIIVVDNAPGDGTAEYLAAEHPDVSVVANGVNSGYAGGNNVGVAAATSDWVLLLNPDTVLQDGALEALMRAAREHPDALITPKLLNPDGTINACGLEMHVTGITSCRAYRQPGDSVRGTHPVPVASGAALLVRKAVFDDIGGFDESYFMYMEDLDLSLRARLLGYEIVCAADAIVTHAYELGMSPEKFGLLERNRIQTLLRVLERRTLVRLAVALCLTEFATWSFALLRGSAYVGAKVRGYRWLVASRARWWSSPAGTPGSAYGARRWTSARCDAGAAFRATRRNGSLRQAARRIHDAALPPGVGASGPECCVKMAHVSATFPPYWAGTGNVVYHNARLMHERGHEVTVFTAKTDRDGEMVFPFRVERLPALLRIGNAPLTPALIARLGGFDLIHLHFPYIFGAELTLAAAKRHRVPLVVTYHNDLLARGIRGRIFRLYTELNQRVILNNVTRLVATSKDYAEHSFLADVAAAQGSLGRPQWRRHRDLPAERDVRATRPAGHGPANRCLLCALRGWARQRPPLQGCRGVDRRRGAVAGHARRHRGRG